MSDTVDQDKFDALLGKMLKQKPVSKAEISAKIAAKKAAKKFPVNGKKPSPK